MDTYYRASDKFVTREIAGEVLVVPVGEQTAKLNGMIMFSEAGAFLWKLLVKKSNRRELLLRLAEEYGKSSQEVEADVDEFLEKALKSELIVELSE